MSASASPPLHILRYGEERSGEISWNIRRVGKELFSDPQFIVKEGINNAVDETANLVEVEYDGNSLLMKDDGERGLKIGDFVFYGESRKYGTGVTGRYGHGFKDAALSSGECIYCITNRGGRVEQYQIYEDRSSQAILYRKIETNRRVEKGTEFIIPLKPEAKFLYKVGNKELEGVDAIRRSIQEYARLGIRLKQFRIAVNNSEVESGVSGGKEVEVDCSEGMKARGIYLEAGEVPVGIHIYARGLYLDSMPFHMKGSLLLDMSFLLQIPRMITPKKEIWWGHKKWRTQIEPALKAWIKDHRLELEDGDKEFLQEVSRFLKFVLRESKPSEPTKPKRAYTRSGQFKGRKPPGNKAPDVRYIDEPSNPRFVDITPETILVNKGHKLWSLLQMFRGDLTRMRLFLTVVIRSIPILRRRENQTRSYLESIREYWAEMDQNLVVAWNKVLRL